MDEIFKVLQLENNKFDNLFDGQRANLENVLDNESIITEFRSCNPLLLNFLKDAQFEKMVGFLIEEPTVEDTNSRQFRFPFISCELLTCQVPLIYDQFFERQPVFLEEEKHEDPSESSEMQVEEQNEGEFKKDKTDSNNGVFEHDHNLDVEDRRSSVGKGQLDKMEIEHEDAKESKEITNEQQLQDQQPQQQFLSKPQLDKSANKKDIPRDKMFLLGLLFSFFESTTPVNITLAGYVAKVFNQLLQIAKNKNKEQEMVEYLLRQNTIALNISNHLHSKSAAEILVKILISPSPMRSPKELLQRILETKLMIIDRLLTIISDPSTDFEVLLNIVSAIIDTITIYTTFHDGKEIVQHLISQPLIKQILFNVVSENSNVCFNNSSLLCAIVSLFNSIEARRSEDDENSFKECDIDFSAALKTISEATASMVAYLQGSSGSNETLQTAYRETIQPLGSAKLKIIELFCLLLKIDDSYIVEELSQHNLFVVLLELFRKYEWNNMLHTFVERIIIQAAQINSPAIRKALFTDAKLIECLLENTLSIDSQPSGSESATSAKFRKGQLGHVTRIANFISKICDGNPDIQQYINVDVWIDLKEHFLIQTNQINDKNLGEYAMIDHESPSHQLHLSYDIEDIKQKSEDFLFGHQHETSPEKEEYHSQAFRDAEKEEMMDEYFFNSHQHEQPEDQGSQHEQQLAEHEKDQFEQLMSKDQNNQVKSSLFEGFDTIQNTTNQDNQESQQQAQVQQSESVNSSFDDIMKSFGFVTPAQTENTQHDASNAENQIGITSGNDHNIAIEGKEQSEQNGNENQEEEYHKENQVVTVEQQLDVIEGQGVANQQQDLETPTDQGQLGNVEKISGNTNGEGVNDNVEGNHDVKAGENIDNGENKNNISIEDVQIDQENKHKGEEKQDDGLQEEVGIKGEQENNILEDVIEKQQQQENQSDIAVKNEEDQSNSNPQQI